MPVPGRTRESLRRALRAFGIIVLPVGLSCAVAGVYVRGPSLSAIGLIAAVFAVWMLYASRPESRTSEGALALRVALATQVAATLVVGIEPAIGLPIAVGVLIPVVLALPHVGHRAVTGLMAISAGVGALSLAAPLLLPWGAELDGPVAQFLVSATLILVFVLFLLFLWHASTRMSNTATELRHVIEMSRDLAATLDPQDVGGALARHIATVSGAAECALSTWDRASDRVVTFGYHPPERLSSLDAVYDLGLFPATRAVLQKQERCVIDVDDPSADASEVAYLRSIGQRSLVMLPLVVRGETIGIVELTSPKPRAFSERQIELAWLLAREAAVTFDNARLYDEVRNQAFRDPLTGLANRMRLQDRVEHALQRLHGRSPNHAALVFIDLDNFKDVNDRFGHAIGDRVLLVVADRIRATLRPGDTAARLGGDEFAILLEDVEGSESAAIVSRRLLELLSEPVELDDIAPVIGASIGIAVSGFGANTGDELLRNADVAMYAAKAAGRGQVVPFRPDLLDAASARSELAAMLRGAEARRELQVHFQPVVQLEDGAPVGLEALVRWQPRGHLLHMPAEFIGLAEETGEILPIGRWVLGEGCRRLRAWQTRFDLPDLRLYVNLSSRQFRDEGLIPMITAALAEAGLQAGSLTLEITESTLLTPGFETVERIGELRALGVRLAIDNFGTGYSSLGYLHAFQIDELKIDRSFVPSSDAVGDAHVISQAMVELGRALSLDMVAEGIETEDQADWFRGLGCRLGQGYLYARPMVATEVERYFRRRSAISRAAARAVATGGGPASASRSAVRSGVGITDVLGPRAVRGVRRAG